MPALVGQQLPINPADEHNGTVEQAAEFPLLLVVVWSTTIPLSAFCTVLIDASAVGLLDRADALKP